MIYLVSKQKSLFETDEYKELSPEKAIEMLSRESLLACDTETTGIDPYENTILTIQLGNENFQIVWDCTSYSLIMLKELLERPDILYLWHNYCFDSMYLLKESIVQKNFFDTMIAERLLNNGTPIREYSISLKTCALKYCNYDMDKSARGEIITKGLSTRVIVYAGTDIKYMPAIYEAQMKKLKELDLVRAAEFESKFTIVTGYIKLCGVKLDEDKWKAKMKSDQKNRNDAEEACNNWVLDFYKRHNGENSYIEYPFLVDSTFVHPGDSTELKFKEVPKDLQVIRQYAEKSDKYGTLFYNVCKIPFGWFNKSNTFHPFIETVNAVQLDLFASTEAKFGDRCILNWSSSAQVIPVLELLGCKLEVFDKKEKRVKKSVDQNVLESQREISPLVSLYLEYKNWDTVCNAFGEKFLKARSKDGRIRGDWRSIGTDTWRMSCKGQVHGQRINLQQLPADAVTRSCFIAEKGNSWVSIDMAG